MAAGEIAYYRVQFVGGFDHRYVAARMTDIRLRVTLSTTGQALILRSFSLIASRKPCLRWKPVDSAMGPLTWAIRLCPSRVR